MSTRRQPHPAFDRSEDYQRRRQAMVQTAAYLFNRSGFHATSIGEIVAELGVSKAALYYYFADKTDLLYHCHLQAVENGEALAEAAAGAGGSGLQKLETYIRTQFDALVRKEGAAWVLGDISLLRPAQREEVRRRPRRVDGLVRGFIEEGIADGSIACAEPRITEYFLMGAINWLPRWYRPELRQSAAQLADIFLHFAIDGLRPRG